MSRSPTYPPAATRFGTDHRADAIPTVTTGLTPPTMITAHRVAGRSRFATFLLGIAIAGIPAACGETYVDPDVTVASPGRTIPATTLAAIDPNTDVDTLLAMMLTELERLSGAIVSEDDTQPIEDRVEQAWSVLQPQLEDDPALEINVKSALDFAQLAVDRKRPADADKAVKVISDEIAARRDA